MVYKKVLLMSSALLMAFGFSGCGQNGNSEDSIQVVTAAPEKSEDTSENSENAPSNKEKTTIKLGLLSGVNSYVASHLMDSNDTNDSYEKYEFLQSDSVSELTEKLKSGEIQAATLPADVAARLYNETNGSVMVAAVSSYCNYYVASSGIDVKGVAGLAGKTITVSKEDLMAKSMLNIILKSAKISNCTIEYADNTNAIVKGLTDGTIKLALIQEPFLSQAVASNSNITVATDLYDDWTDTTATELPTGCLVVNRDFYSTNPEVMSYFLKDFDASVNMAKSNIDETAKMMERYKMTSSAAVAKAAIPGTSISISTGKDMKETLNAFMTYMNTNDSAVIGGKLPDDKFYYIDGQ